MADEPKYYYHNLVAMSSPPEGFIQIEDSDVGEEPGFKYLGAGVSLNEALENQGIEVLPNTYLHDAVTHHNTYWR